MTIAEAKKELRSYKDALASIKMLETRIAVTKMSINSIGSASFDTRVDSSSSTSRQEQYVIKLGELERELQDTKLFRECRANDIALKIDKLPYPYSTILCLEHLEGKRNNVILKELGREHRYKDMSREWLFKRKSRAIKMYAEL